MPNYFGMVNTERSKTYTLLAIKSFLAKTNFDHLRGDQFFLIDNDRSMGRALNQLPSNFNIFENPFPKSFAENVNQILKIAIDVRADLIFLNNDMVFTENWLDPLQRRKRSITIPVCNQHELFAINDFQLKPEMDLEDYAGHEGDLEAIVRLRISGLDHSNRYPTLPFLPFYCFRLPIEVSKEVGLFDEGFGIGGGEDIDYRIRANLCGFNVELALESYVLHFMGKSTWRGGESQAEVGARNQLYTRKFIEKYGIEMTRIFLFPNHARGQLEKLGLLEDWSAGNYRHIIERCIALNKSR